MNERTNTLLRLLLVCLLALGTVLTLQPITTGVFSESDISIGHSRAKQTQAENTIAFTGDILLGRDVESVINRFGIDYPFALFKTIPPYAALIGNFEAAVPRVHRQTLPPSLEFSVATSALPALHNAGFTHVSLANNHSFDHAEDGLWHSRAALQAVGVEPIGDPRFVATSSVSYVTIEGTIVAVVALHTLYEALSFRDLDALFQQVNQSSDLQVVFVHWGEEYELRHNTAQEQLANTLVQLGTDLIIGHHPHVVQDVGLIRGVPVFYSIGNFIFDQYFNDEVQTGLIIELEIRADGQYLHVLPVTSLGSKTQPRLLPELEGMEMLLQLAERSAPALQTSLRTGEIGPLHNLASSQETVIIAE